MRIKPHALLVVLLIAAWAAAPATAPVQDRPKAPPDSRQLAEPFEQSENEIQPPELVMALLGIRPGLVIGEVGAGRGRLTVHLAARVGATGKVYANDIDRDALDYLRQRCQRQGLSNVEIVPSLPDDARFRENTLDMVVMAWVFHHVDQPVPLWWPRHL
jgi:2-polyprenyl-3-methyl-5-hydroxy-6-metoxy-1,4-benzoquinol methylase